MGKSFPVFSFPKRARVTRVHKTGGAGLGEIVKQSRAGTLSLCRVIGEKKKTKTSLSSSDFSVTRVRYADTRSY